MIVPLILSFFILSLVPGEVSAHAPESMELSYDFGTRNLTVTITHTTPLPDQHYIESVEVFRNEISIIQESYTSQPELRTFSLYFDVPAADGDILNVTAVCNVFGSLTEEIEVVGPRARMDLSVSPAITLIEMGDQQSFTVNIYREDDGMPVDGATVTASAVLGEVTEVSALGLGGYEFTYTAPELEDEDIEVINITAQMNGYHTTYHEFDMDIVFPVDPAKKIAVSITPAFTTITENEARDLTVQVTAGGSDLDVESITVTRSGGIVSTEKTGTGTFILTFKASEVQRDTQGWINVVAEKEGYQRGEKRISFTIRDSTGPITDDDDDTADDDITVSNEKDFINGTTITVFLIIVILIGGIVGFIIYRRRKKNE
jgi:hypothetical protein